MSNLLRQQGKILLLVDDAANLSVLANWLKELQIDWVSAQTAEEAFERLAENAEVYALCLVDEVDSLNVFPMVNKAIHHKDVAQVPILILKASPADQKRHTYQDLLRMVELQVKPLSFEHFRDSVMRYIVLHERRLELASAYEDASALWGSVSDGVIGLDRDGYILFLNPTASRLLGASSDELLGVNIQGLTEHPKHSIASAWHEHPISTVCRRKEMLQIDATRLWRLDGRPIPVKLVAVPMSSASGMEVMLAFKQKWESRDDQAPVDLWVDQLTGALTRNALEARIFDVVDGEEDSDQSLGLLLVNLDHFRYVNEAVSHKVGDLVLKSVVERIEQCVRDDDLVARVSGDEFGVLIHHVKDEGQIEPVAQKVAQQFEQPFLLGGHEVHCTASIGVAMCPRDGRTPSSLLAVASAGVERVQEEGGNGIALEGGASFHEQRSLQEERSDIRRVISSQLWNITVEPVYTMAGQPLPAFVSCDLTWVTDNGSEGTITTLDREAARLGMQNRLADDVLQFMLSYADDQLRHSDVDIVVPLIGPCIRHHGFLMRWLDEFQWPVERLIIQVSERDLLGSRGDAYDNFSFWRNEGVRMALTGFGSSLGALNVLEPLNLWALETDYDIFSRPRMREWLPVLAKTLRAKLWISGVRNHQGLGDCMNAGVHLVQGVALDDPKAEE